MILLRKILSTERITERSTERVTEAKPRVKEDENEMYRLYLRQRILHYRAKGLTLSQPDLIWTFSLTQNALLAAFTKGHTLN